MVRAERELVQIALHVLGADVDVGAANRCLEQPLEAFHRVGVVGHAMPVVVVGVLFLAVRHDTMLVAVRSE
jgi:hypothetical protein